MVKKDIAKLTINKNRGWRGLAEIAVLNEDNDLTTKHIFSFSQEVWDDMIFRNLIVIESESYYYIIHIVDTGKNLPRPDQQRSVLIKNVQVTVDKVNKIKKEEWLSKTRDDGKLYCAISNFRNNRNNHTTSDWNCIGLRVLPSI